MYHPKNKYQKILGTIKLLPNKSEKEILRVLNVYDTSLEDLSLNTKFSLEK
jgi:hypothetical protein